MATDWKKWKPVDRANLTFIRQGGRILLIEKKRGLGAGKVNAPGGKIDPGESALESAVRETEEEIRVTPTGMSKRGELFFQFRDGYALHCTVFLADGFVGEPAETEEAVPFWVDEREIPYDRMWADDATWIPSMLEGGMFIGYFEFDDDVMLTHDVSVVESFASE